MESVDAPIDAPLKANQQVDAKAVDLSSL